MSTDNYTFGHAVKFHKLRDRNLSANKKKQKKMRMLWTKRNVFWTHED